MLVQELIWHNYRCYLISKLAICICGFASVSPHKDAFGTKIKVDQANGSRQRNVPTYYYYSYYYSAKVKWLHLSLLYLSR